MKQGPTEQERAERRGKAVAMGEARVPVTDITRLLGVSRNTVMKWLSDAGVEPTMLREQRTPKGGASLSAGKVLSIEEGVRKRVEAMKEEGPDEAA